MRSLSHISFIYLIKTLLSGIIFLLCYGYGFASDNVPLTLYSQKKIEVPFSYYNGLIQLNIKLNGIPLSFIYDTGAEHTILTNKEVAVLLNLKIVKQIDVFGADLTKQMTAYVTEPLTMELYDTKIVKQKNNDEPKITFVEEVVKTVDVRYFNKFEPILILERDIFNTDAFSNAISGILGASFFSNMMVSIDYKSQVLNLHPFGVKPQLKGFKELPVNFSGHKPVMTVLLKINEDDDTTEAKLLIDTGCSIPLLLLENIDTKFHLPSKTINGKIGVGLGGDLTGWIGLIQSVKIENFTFDNLVTKFQDMDSISLSNPNTFRDGLIGNDILNRFTLLIDNINKKVYIKPNKNISKPIKYDKSGLTLFASGMDLNDFYVKHVIPGSPADIAGLKPEDKIIKIQCFSTRLWSLNSIVKLLSGKEKKKIKLRVLRGDKKIDFTFRLKDMFK